MLTFAWPWMILALPLPLVVGYLFKKYSAQQSIQSPVVRFPNLKCLADFYTTPQPMRIKLLNWRVLISALVWIALVVAMMRPELVQDLAYADNKGYDLMLAVDLSRSMDTVDFRYNTKVISRIAATKKVVTNFVEQRHGDRIGLIVFGEQAFLAIPLTLDSSSVVKMLNNLMVGMAGESTAIGDAIGIGVKNLRKRPLVSRVLILLTDGDDTASHIPPLEAAKIAAMDKIKIYTIAMGDKIDEKLLAKIADMTGGNSFKVTSVDALEEVYAKIDQLEKSETKQQALLIKKSLYQWSLLIGLLGLGVLFLANTYRYRNKYAIR